jgi:hypothetical protein
MALQRDRVPTTPLKPPSGASTADPGKKLAEALTSVIPDGGARLSVAAIGLNSGHREPRVAAYAKYNDRSTYDAASIIKVNILAALLLQAQDEKRQLTKEERSHAKAVIQSSDNGSAGVLWRAIGRADGLNAANKRLGLVSTEGGHGNRWGLTQTTAKGQLTLLHAVLACCGCAAEAMDRAVRGGR